MRLPSFLPVPWAMGLVFLFLLGRPSTGHALDITTVDGITYRQCQDLHAEPDTLAFTHSSGTARIVYENLPEPLKKKYFDSAKVAAYRQQIEEAKLAAAAKVAEAKQREELAKRDAERRRVEQVAILEQKQEEFAKEGRQMEADAHASMVADQLAEKEAEERPQKIAKAALAVAGIVAFGLLARLLIGNKKAND